MSLLFSLSRRAFTVLSGPSRPPSPICHAAARFVVAEVALLSQLLLVIGGGDEVLLAVRGRPQQFLDVVVVQSLPFEEFLGHQCQLSFVIL